MAMESDWVRYYISTSILVGPTLMLDANAQCVCSVPIRASLSAMKRPERDNFKTKLTEILTFCGCRDGVIGYVMYTLL